MAKRQTRHGGASIQPAGELSAGPQRLQKILAHAGLASRRKAEEYILQGRITVNGETVEELGAKADPLHDHIKVDGKLLRQPREHLYLVLNKPRDCVTTVSDPEGRRTVMHYVRNLHQRVYPVGRLDYHSEGLLMMTNDGDFAARIMAPANHVPKTYLVKVNGPLTEEQAERFRSGIPLHGRRTAQADLKLIRAGRNPWYEVTIIEGRQNQIKIMFKNLGRLVEKLKRVRIGFLLLRDLKPGEYRLLTPAEVARFQKLLSMETQGKEARHESGDR